MLRPIFKIFALLLLSAALAACGDDEPEINWGGGGGNSGGNGGTTVGNAAQVARRMETPELKAGNILISHWSVEGGDSVMTYCLEYDFSAFHSRWVAFRFDAATRAKNVSRKDYDIRPQYPVDPFLEKNYSANLAIGSDASFNGYQHGHICASADRLYSRTANDNTFFMTNMSPQIGNFNAPYWSAFENKVQSLGRNASFADTLYVVKGGTIAEGQYSSRVAGGRIVVPNYYFMALLKVRGNSYSSIAFLMEHKNYGNATPSNSEMRGKAVSVNSLEAFTGINFFHNLPDVSEEIIEDGCQTSAWGF